MQKWLEYYDKMMYTYSLGETQTVYHGSQFIESYEKLSMMTGHSNEFVTLTPI